ncbi:unnamed protein product [Sphenostylis stenocarpa]|nr:unnamed protein product [Sphenostylis stenocarpa]CAJ1977171.1 unnamed protein product [Sphenostylis stenocarpa]
MDDRATIVARIVAFTLHLRGVHNLLFYFFRTRSYYEAHHHQQQRNNTFLLHFFAAVGGASFDFSPSLTLLLQQPEVFIQSNATSLLNISTVALTLRTEKFGNLKIGFVASMVSLNLHWCRYDE